MELLTNLWNNQPTTVMGIGVAIFVLGICISYKYISVSGRTIHYMKNFFFNVVKVIGYLQVLSLTLKVFSLI